FAHAEPDNEVVERQPLSRGKEEAVDFADRARKGKVFAQVDEKFDHLALGRGGIAEGGARGGGGAGHPAATNNGRGRNSR
ncbi:MAG: hypothetical protein ACK56I_35605, partial [bacterium]